MAHTDITLSQHPDGKWTAQNNGTAVSDGDTFAISASGGAVTIFFSPALHSVMSPQPQSPLTLHAGSNAKFAFTSSSSGAYHIIYGSEPVLFAEFPTDEVDAIELMLNVPTFDVLVPVSTAAVAFSGPNMKPQGN